MSRAPTSGFTSALGAAHLEGVVFAELQFKSGSVYVCSRERDIVWNGQTWLGKGRVGAIEPIEEGSQLEARSIAMTLSAIPGGMLATALDPTEYKNRPCKIWLGLIEPDVIDFDFLREEAQPVIGGELLTLGVTRAGATASRVKSDGTLDTAVAANTVRHDYEPVTRRARGMKTEGAKFNYLRNNSAQGAVAGTPGTAPTNWTLSAAADGLTRQIVGTGTEDGIDYVDVRYHGTTSAAGTLQHHPETLTQITGVSGEIWSATWYCRLVGGTLTGISNIRTRISERDAAGAFLTSSETAFTPTAAALIAQRYSHTRTLDNAGTARVTMHWLCAYANATAVDFTLRLGLPQMEQNSLPSSVIRTASAGVTRNADVPAVLDISAINVAAGITVVCEWELAGDVTSVTLFSFNNGTANNRIGLRYVSAGNSNQAVVLDGGAAQVSLNSSIQLTEGRIYRSAFRVSANDFARSDDGAAATTDTAGTVPAVDRLHIGCSEGGAEQGGLWVRRVTIYPRLLSDADLRLASGAYGSGPLSAGQGERLLTPVGPFLYRMDSLDFELGETGALRLTAHSRLEDWQRPRVRRYNNEDQQSEHPGDKFFEYAEQMVNAEFMW